MERWRVIHLLIAGSPLVAFAQSGPGGAGNSTINVLWLRPESGVNLTSGMVTQWSDQSGNGNHAYQPGAIPNSAPAFVPSAVNGYPSLDLDGVNDQLWVNHAASLDLTSWHFYLVVKPDVQKDFNAWMVKGDDNQENYEVLSYSDGNVHTPIRFTDNTRTAPNTPAAQVSTTEWRIIEYSYTASSPAGRQVFRNSTSQHTDTESKTPRTNTLPLFIGNERSTTGRCVNGHITEVVGFNGRLNTTRRILVNNYLAAKYGLTLSVNDVYREDNTGRGNFDHDVAGLGRISASDMQNSGQGSGIVLIDKAAYSGLGNNEFLLWGHNNGALGSWGVGDLPIGVEGRLERVWRVSERNTAGNAAVDVGAVNITFDLAGMGNVDASHLRLLVDSDQDGFFANETAIGGASHLGGTLYRFTNINALVDGVRFSLGTTNLSVTPLPIELVYFRAKPLGREAVGLEWATATEWDNDRFEVERSADMGTWHVVAEQIAVGNSNSLVEYTTSDAWPLKGTAYYRLRQIDTDGTSTLSHVVVVDHSLPTAMELMAYPNPAQGQVFVRMSGAEEGPFELSVLDNTGREAYHRSMLVQPNTEHAIELGGLSPGQYTLRLSSSQGARSTRIFLVR